MTSLNIEITGNRQGHDLALIHGWGIGKEVWQPVLELLEQHFRIHLVDLPGYGASPESTGCFEHTAQQLIEALPQGATFCGWSLGGQLALQAALLAPEHPGRLVLIGTSPRFTRDENWPEAQPGSLLETFCSALADNADATRQRFIALLNQGDAKARMISRAMTKQMLTAQIPESTSLLAGLHWLRDVDLRKQIISVTTPTLLIHGEHDPLMPLTAAHWLNETLPNSQLEVFSGAAHAPFLNDPEHFAKLIGEYCHAFANN